MSIKSFFGKGLASMLEAHQGNLNRAAALGAQVRESTEMERMFGNCSPAVVAFKIENGYVVRTIDQEVAYHGGRQRGFTYCKDHQEIAEHIIATEMKRKLGVRDEEYQQEMFAAEKARAVAMQGSGQFAQVKRASNRI
jgi:hypothetical protein